MEAVPKLPMIYFELKISPVCPDFATPFKNFISSHYSEDGNSYDREINELENLRNKATRVPRDFTGCSLLKRYYSQIYSLLNRFSAFDPNVGVECVWADVYSGQTVIGDLDFELSCVLYNIGALHAELGALDMRNTADSMKVSCTHFQCAVWAFQHLRDDNRLYKSKDMSHELLSFFVQVMLSQAQECILEKSMLDNRKSSIVAKVAAQVVEYYSSSLLILLQSAVNTSASHTIVDIVGSKLYKEWKKFIEFKVSYYNSICALFMGNLAEEQQKMGERVAWFQSAEAKLNESIKLSKQIDKPELNEGLVFVSDVINVKLQNAIKENDFVYHEKVPTNDKLTEVKGVSLVKGIPFSVCDPEICGNDIFSRLVPIEAHETNSIYSAKKDEIMRDIRYKIDDKDEELTAYMASLQLDKEKVRTRDEPIPDKLIEVCAAMSVNPNVIIEVNNVLTELEEISEEVDKAINETKSLLEEEENKEKEHQNLYGKRPISMIVVELNKELTKHEETHNKALLSNRSLRDNLERHCDDIKLLITSSAKNVSSLLPPTNTNVPFDETNLTEMEKLLDKVNEMKTQRSSLENQLRETMATDDLMKQVLTHNKQEIEEVFKNEIKKYDKTRSLIEQNLSAQDNILRALTKANAKYSETRRALLDNQSNRNARIDSLIHTFEVFKELQINSKKGLEFYQKFQNIVARLHARTRGVCRVQDEERAQISLSYKKKNTNYSLEHNVNVALNGDTPGTPKLKDYLQYMKQMSKPIPAANVLANNSVIMPPLAQNYPPVSLSQNSLNNRYETNDQTLPINQNQYSSQETQQNQQILPQTQTSLQPQQEQQLSAQPQTQQYIQQQQQHIQYSQTPTLTTQINQQYTQPSPSQSPQFQQPIQQFPHQPPQQYQQQYQNNITQYSHYTPQGMQQYSGHQQTIQSEQQLQVQTTQYQTQLQQQLPHSQQSNFTVQPTSTESAISQLSYYQTPQQMQFPATLSPTTTVTSNTIAEGVSQKYQQQIIAQPTVQSSGHIYQQQQPIVSQQQPIHQYSSTQPLQQQYTQYQQNVNQYQQQQQIPTIQSNPYCQQYGYQQYQGMTGQTPYQQMTNGFDQNVLQSQYTPQVLNGQQFPHLTQELDPQQIQPLQPISEPIKQSDETQLSKTVIPSDNKPESDLLKQFDPLY